MMTRSVAQVSLIICPKANAVIVSNMDKNAFSLLSPPKRHLFQFKPCSQQVAGDTLDQTHSFMVLMASPFQEGHRHSSRNCQPNCRKFPHFLHHLQPPDHLITEISPWILQQAHWRVRAASVVPPKTHNNKDCHPLLVAHSLHTNEQKAFRDTDQPWKGIPRALNEKILRCTHQPQQIILESHHPLHNPEKRAPQHANHTLNMNGIVEARKIIIPSHIDLKREMALFHPE